MEIRVTYLCWGCGSEKVEYEEMEEIAESISGIVIWNLCPNCTRRKEVKKDEEKVS